MNAEYPEARSCPQKDSAEHEEYAGAQSVDSREVAEQDGADLLERILSRDNLILISIKKASPEALPIL